MNGWVGGWMVDGWVGGWSMHARGRSDDMDGWVHGFYTRREMCHIFDFFALWATLRRFAKALLPPGFCIDGNLLTTHEVLERKTFKNLANVHVSSHHISLLKWGGGPLRRYSGTRITDVHLLEPMTCPVVSPAQTLGMPGLQECECS